MGIRSLAGFVYTFLYIVLCKTFMDVFAEKKQHISAGKMCFAVVVLTIIDFFISTLLIDYFVIKQIVIILLGTIAMWLCYQIGILKSGVIVLFYQGLCIITDYITWMILQKLLAITADNSILLQFLMGTLSQLLVFCFIIVLRHGFMQNRTETLTDFEWAKFSVFPVFTTVALAAMYINFEGLENIKQMNTLICLAFGMLFLNIFVFYLLWDTIEREAKISKEQLSTERAENATKMYRQISENFDKLKKREHEYKNEMTIIASLLRQNELEKLNTLLDKYYQENVHRMDAIDTNHVIVNAILNTKYQEAREKGIVFVLKFNDLSGLNMEDQDIVVILSNMLNNAIEACEKCEGKRIIKVKILKEDGRIIFSVVNTIHESPRFVSGKYKTTKEEQQFHGMGIENVKEIVDKYGGSCAIRHDKEQFYFVVLFTE